MNYKRLGRCGLKVGAISLGAGSWGTGTADEKCVREMMAQAMDMGIIYFDNAESYANGNAEVVMGKALRQLGWSRIRYVVSTKFFWGLEKGPNQKNTLNRKYLLHAIEASLKRSQLDYVDIAYCHRADPHTPIEETVWAFHNMIERGYALYWGTSEWSAQEIQTAIGIAERHSLHKPVVEQPEYNLLNRRKVESEYPRVSRESGIGLAIWSPLAGGILSGKYVEGVAPGTRAAAMAGLPEMGKSLTDRRRNSIVAQLAPVAADLDVPLAQLALAWCARNPDVSTLIIEASTPQQIVDNVKALDLVPRLTPEVFRRIDNIIGDYSESWVGGSPWHYDD
ncbi:aldo/keto reductase [Paraburkholderia diazotrophica]|uniref:Voltage-dependent potassium channel beta subunit, animal n=1 Tax=Paraburkholderia diazotrophica TaxID=667676 RepID=A0A1H7CSA6_9BURK|nr:aldo/keto reductase [Paraburkholderia diazotrophica]SEJ88695.1 voltage-dependent potassium channel beta subunit, animal [Paraburkholderia diazotrophica]